MLDFQLRVTNELRAGTVHGSTAAHCCWDHRATEWRCGWTRAGEPLDAERDVAAELGRGCGCLGQRVVASWRLPDGGLCQAADADRFDAWVERAADDADDFRTPGVSRLCPEHDVEQGVFFRAWPEHDRR